MTKKDFSRLTNLLESFGEIGVPGCDLAVYIGGEEVYRHRTGFADLESHAPIAPDTLYPVYSMTKVVTCVAALRLFEEGQFLLSDPVSEYLPEFKEMTVETRHPNAHVTVAPATRPIRIVDLFTMSSGLSYNQDTPNLEKLKQDSDNNFTNKQLVEALAKDPLHFEPGTHYHYGFSHDVLARLVEVLSGKTLGEFFSDAIFVPLGMHDSFFCVPADKQYRFVSCYYYDEDTKKHTRPEADELPLKFLDPDNKFESGGGGLVSTVDDYAKFANTQCAGGTSPNSYRLLSRATIALMHENQLNDSRLAEFNYPENGGYGYGLGVRTLINRAAGNNNATLGSFGWSGLAGTHVLIDPATNLSFTYAQQIMPRIGINSKQNSNFNRITNVLYSCL